MHASSPFPLFSSYSDWSLIEEDVEPWAWKDCCNFSMASHWAFHEQSKKQFKAVSIQLLLFFQQVLSNVSILCVELHISWNTQHAKVASRKNSNMQPSIISSPPAATPSCLFPAALWEIPIPFSFQCQKIALLQKSINNLNLEVCLCFHCFWKPPMFRLNVSHALRWVSAKSDLSCLQTKQKHACPSH